MGSPGRRGARSGSGRGRAVAGGAAAPGDGEAEAARAQEETDPYTRAREIALGLLTHSPRTRAQLGEALRRREVPEDVVEQVLGRLSEVGLIDDAAFAQAWVQSRHRGRGLARRALAAELRTRGVDDDTVHDAVDELDTEDEAARSRELIGCKLVATRGLVPQVRLRRLVGMLARKGYPSGLAYRVVREALEADGADTEQLPEVEE